MYVVHDQEMYEFGGAHENLEVHIDESKFGKCKLSKGHKGKPVKGVWVFGIVECWKQQDGSLRRGKIMACAVRKRNKKTLIPIIMRHVLPGTHIVSDCWKACDCLDDPNDICGHMHHTHGKVNHSETFQNTAGETTNMIEGSWKWMKAAIPQNAYNETAIQDHIFEHIWRVNNQGRTWAALIEGLAQIAHDSEVGWTFEKQLDLVAWSFKQTQRSTFGSDKQMLVPIPCGPSSRAQLCATIKK